MSIATHIRAAALACAVVATPAFAQSSQSYSQTATFGPAVGDQTNTAGIPIFYFNSDLGTLNSITFATSYGFSSVITVTNPNTTSAGVGARTQSAAQFGSSDAGVTTVLNGVVNNLNDPVDGNAVSFGSATLTPIAYDLRGTRSSTTLPVQGSSATFTSTGSGTTAATTDFATLDLAAFSTAGYGTFLPTLSTLSGALISASPSAGGGEVVTSNGSLTITYNYDGAAFTPPANPIAAAVPEPATWLSMILGMGTIGVMLRVLRRSDERFTHRVRRLTDAAA